MGPKETRALKTAGVGTRQRSQRYMESDRSSMYTEADGKDYNRIGGDDGDSTKSDGAGVACAAYQ